LRSVLHGLVFRLVVLAVVLGVGGYVWFSRATEAAPSPDQMRVMMTSAVIKRDQPGGARPMKFPGPFSSAGTSPRTTF
jgi:hypothetical protein